MTDARRLRVMWRSADIWHGSSVTDVESGEEVGGYIPLDEGPKLLHSQRTGQAVEITLFLQQDGVPFLIAPDTVATRRCVVRVVA